MESAATKLRWRMLKIPKFKAPNQPKSICNLIPLHVPHFFPWIWSPGYTKISAGWHVRWSHGVFIIMPSYIVWRTHSESTNRVCLFIFILKWALFTCLYILKNFAPLGGATKKTKTQSQKNWRIYFYSTYASNLKLRLKLKDTPDFADAKKTPWFVLDDHFCSCWFVVFIGRVYCKSGLFGVVE